MAHRGGNHRLRIEVSREGSLRAGFTIVELTAALILLGVVFTVSVSMLVTVARQRRSVEQRQFALQLAANLMERTAARGWSDIQVGSQPLPDLPPGLSRALPGLEEQVEVTDEKQEHGAKQITVTVRWTNSAGQMVSPVQLKTWVYPLKEAAP